jgi:hypothetical protein
MKPAGPSLLYFIVAGSLAAQPAEPAPPGKTSARLTEVIRTTLPKFTPPVTPPAAAPPLLRDPDVLELPKIVIQEKRLPGNDPDVWLSDRAIQQKAMAAYRGSMTGLEWAMNSWFIPLFSPPASARARQYYAEHKLAAEIDRLNGIIKMISLSDPKEAAKLRQAMDPRKLPKDD